MTLVVLNGTSSAGKTSIARAFQEIAPRLFLNFSIDAILYALPPTLVAKLERGEPADVPFLDLVRGYYACVRELAAQGHDLIIDHAIITEREADLLRAAVEGFDVLTVALDCPVEILTERERQRGNRRPGLAAMQSARVHQWLTYDLRVDSARLTPEEAAREILAALERR